MPRKTLLRGFATFTGAQPPGPRAQLLQPVATSRLSGIIDLPRPHRWPRNARERTHGGVDQLRCQMMSTALHSDRDPDPEGLLSEDHIARSTNWSADDVRANPRRRRACDKRGNGCRLRLSEAGPRKTGGACDHPKKAMLAWNQPVTGLGRTGKGSRSCVVLNCALRCAVVCPPHRDRVTLEELNWKADSVTSRFGPPQTATHRAPRSTTLAKMTGCRKGEKRKKKKF